MEERKVLEQPGNVSNVGYNAHIINKTYNGTFNSTKATASRKVADDDAAMAIIQNPLQKTETAGIQQDARSSDVTITSIIKENLLKLKKLATKLEGRLRELGDDVNGFKASGVLERMKKEIEAFKAGGVLESLRKDIEALKTSNNGLERLKKEIEAIIAFEGFLLGVHEKIDEFTKFVQFSLEQIPEVEQHMADINKALELGKYTVAQMRDETLKALQGQANSAPERILHFIKDRD